MPTYRDLTENEMNAGVALIRMVRQDDRYCDATVDSIRRRRLDELTETVGKDFDLDTKHLAFVCANMLESRMSNVRFPDSFEDVRIPAL